LSAHHARTASKPRVFDAVLAWCADNSLTTAGVNWEIYGDWHEDPAKRRTDVYVLVTRQGGAVAPQERR